MSNCCANVLDAKFDARTAEELATQFRRSGPAKETRLLLHALHDAGIQNGSVLDIGGGIGAVPLELLAAGAERVLSVEASRASIEAAQTLARERGVLDRIEYRRGDFLELADDIPVADVVTLDKVICCYPHMEALVTRSADRARRLYGAVYPRYGPVIRLVNRVQNAIRRLVRSEFRTWIHPTAAIEELLRSRGFEVRTETATLVWRVVVLERRTDISPTGFMYEGEDGHA